MTTNTKSYPPTIRSAKRGEDRSIKRAAARFEVQTTFIGFEVIDYDGRTVAEEVFEDDAKRLAQELNEVAHNRRAVAKLLVELSDSRALEN